jgi:hypothetical protein
MFSFLNKSSPEDDMKQARALFEKVAALKSDTREAHSMRVRMGMLCRAHLDKTFIAGAEQTATWQEVAALATASGEPAPELPTPSKFQKIKSGESEVFVYLPEEYVTEAFILGSKYQKTEVSAPKAIEAMQALANQISYYELRLQEPFVVLTFLRDEVAAEAAAAAQAQEGGSAPDSAATPS